MPMDGPPPKKKSKALMWVGIGCLAIVICSGAGLLGCWYCTKSAVEGAGSAFQAEMQRVSLSLMLSGIQSSCAFDPSGSGTAPYFHPSVYPMYQAQACLVDANVIGAYGDATRAQATSVAGSAYEATATGLGYQAANCTLFTSGSSKIVGCADTTGQFVIVYWENINAVQ
jgi:hypothetical protein